MRFWHQFLEALTRSCYRSYQSHKAQQGSGVCDRGRRRRRFWPRGGSCGVGLGGLLQGVGEDVAVAGGEGDSAEGGEGWGDIGGGDGLEVLAGLDAEAHQEDGDVLIVVVGDAVACAVGARLSEGGAVEEPVGLWKDE